MGKITLGYWGFRGRAQVARHLLTYTGAEFEEKIYTKPEEWFQKDKLNLGLFFPNLPYLIEDNLKMTESMAICNYIVNRSEQKELMGKDLRDQAYVENLLRFIEDLFAEIVKLCFNPEHEKQKGAVSEKVSNWLKELEKFIDGKELTFGYLTVIDFYLAEVDEFVKVVFPELKEKYEFLGKIRQSVEAIPEVMKYYERENAVKGPYLPPSAQIKL